MAPTRAALPAVASPAMVGMRHRLVHAEFEIDSDVLWQSATEKLPDLVRRLKAALTAG